jgi:hypothetical protein
VKSPEDGVRQLGRILSVDPRIDRVAYAYINNGRLTECGLTAFRQMRPTARARATIIPHLIEILHRCGPHALLVPDERPAGARRRGPVVGVIIRAVVREATRCGIAVHTIGTHQVKRSLTPETGEPIKNKDDIHRLVVARFPELAGMFPRPRQKVYDPEQYFTPLLNAGAMYMAFELMPSPNELRQSPR